MSNKEWVRIFSTTDPHYAKIIKSLLTANEIPCIEMDKRDSAYGFGDVELYTLRESAVIAIHLINKHN